MIKLLAFVMILNVCICMGCKMSIKEADECGMRGTFFGNRNTIIPTNDKELDEHCVVIRDSVKCLHDFASTCIEGWIQQVFKMGLTNAAKHFDKRCNDTKDRNEFLSHVKCLLPREKMEPFHICADKDLVMMEKLKDVELNHRIPASCCIFHSFKECIRQNNKAICGEETTDYWDQIISEFSEDSVSFSCANYDTIEKCDKNLNPKVWNELKALASSDDPSVLAQRHKFGSGIAIILEIMKNFSMNK